MLVEPPSLTLVVVAAKLLAAWSNMGTFGQHFRKREIPGYYAIQIMKGGALPGYTMIATTPKINYWRSTVP